MTTDPFTEAARAEAERYFADPGVDPLTLSVIDHAMHMAEWARTHLAAQEPQVTIRTEEGKPATCEVRQGGVLIFAGRDHSADLRVTAQEPTDAEVEAAAKVLWDNGGVLPWDEERESYAALARAALSAARAARREEEKR